MELSDLVFFGKDLYAMCDYTGIVYKIDHSGKVFQRWAIADGDGKRPKPFKGEWALVKDGQMLVGSIGIEWVIDGVVKHHDCEWTKVISKGGLVRNVNWAQQYNELRIHTNTSYPGYLIHEAVAWNERRREWIFLPRRASTGIAYAPTTDATLGANTMLLVSENFEHIESVRVGELEPLWGFTSVKVIPGTDDLMAIKVMETQHEMHSVLYVFDRKG
eukprot:CAMPEP_0168592572 /NCGR_PEP_ID=MMETSP0420-20121227/7812_1 /TAXON_ID=498008 /ORGANISM="Pessonella sp." /LENGTH=216 /DNA_ID=CAMNT_0008628585 /DNA_START=259 /DNA_END=906 /DNA_ORIENTATION=-